MAPHPKAAAEIKRAMALMHPWKGHSGRGHGRREGMESAVTPGAQIVRVHQESPSGRPESEEAALVPGSLTSEQHPPRAGDMVKLR